MTHQPMPDPCGVANLISSKNGRFLRLAKSALRADATKFEHGRRGTTQRKPAMPNPIPAQQLTRRLLPKAFHRLRFESLLRWCCLLPSSGC